MSRRARPHPSKRDIAMALATEKPRRFCDVCGLNEAEHMACEEPDCGRLVTEKADSVALKTGERIDLLAPWPIPTKRIAP